MVKFMLEHLEKSVWDIRRVLLGRSLREEDCRSIHPPRMGTGNSVLSASVTLDSDQRKKETMNGRQPVAQNIRVDHHPGGGHWFAAGLSPNIPSRNRVSMHSSPHFQD
ncbi:uncharacterized protein LOC112198452 [Rosa chinensis]|uniref:uncharacterized protein LOC112198452 n=1 Tax=Rosa chinensis TaxID=74649 RepID=UPI001AD918A2|nr:uncharacterized protein LOC112198452 [Rosa chinensis]XP_040373771.1 uncharacterized protein LOC112198452 [Rosa chinensis]XP_040373772.1 uncharacterized protein LOC112198452 [Rosa chinensis]